MNKPQKYLIVGLGNPGLRYHKTRHNMGFMTIDYLSEKLSISVRKTKEKAKVGEGIFHDQRVILAKPTTYMNNSGESVKGLLDYYNIPLSGLIVIYDDLDLDLGRIRIRKKGGSGTHNGMKSILAHVKSQQFVRIRIGIGTPDHDNTVAYVLGKIAKQEREEAFKGIQNAAKSCEAIVTEGIDIAMGRYNNL